MKAGRSITLNGESYSFTSDPFINQVNHITINTGGGSNTVNILNTSSASPVTINGGGSDKINIGSGGSVQQINGTVSIEDPPSFATINVDDSADPTARNVTLDTFTPSGDSAWGSITGLAPASINYEYFDTHSVSITTGTAADTVAVHATGVSTNLSSGGGHDAVTVGSGGSVQGIGGTLNIENPPSLSTINVDDSADPSSRNVTLDTFTPAGDSAWGSITGLAPAAINYEYFDISSVSLTTGAAADTVDVHATGVSTNLSSGGGHDAVTVGSGGSVQGIGGTLNIENPAKPLDD